MTELLNWVNWYHLLFELGVFAILWYAFKRTRNFIVKNSRTIIDGLFWLLTRVVTRSISAGLSMKRYCRIQLSFESGRFLQVPGVKGTALDVDQVFVPLTLELGGRQETFTSENVLDAGSRLMVVGDPGSGKTTLIKRIFRECCATTASSPRKGRLPIRLELKTLKPPAFDTDSEAGNWLYDQLQGGVRQIEGFEMAQLFESWVKDAGLLVLLDGLDEVSSDRYTSIAAALRGISQKLSKMSQDNVIVMTMRIQFHQQVRLQFSDDYPQTLYVRPFTPNEIYAFLNRWPFGEATKEQSVSRIYGDLTDRPTLREMCTNPLVLSMYVESDQESLTGELPNTRTEFYERVVDELLVRRRSRQNLMNRASGALRDQREAILGQLAFDNLADGDQPVNSLSWKKAITECEKSWKCSIAEAEIRFREIASETGLIVEERPGETFRFIHQTFCEFLAGIESARGREDGWRRLTDAHRAFVKSGEVQLQSRLVEVIPFALALLPRVQRPSALAEVFTLDDRLVLGRCFLETQLYDHPDWHPYLQRERDYLASGHADLWDETKLRRLHLFSVIVRDARDWLREVARRTSGADLDGVFATIVGRNKNVIATVFATYARQDAAAAVRLAEQLGVNMLVAHPDILVESCEEEPFLALALDRAADDETWALVLAEAGLRFENVARRLNSSAPPNLHANPENEEAKKVGRLFNLCDIDPMSWYGILLSQTFNAPVKVGGPFNSVYLFKGCTHRVSLHRVLNNLNPFLSLSAWFLVMIATTQFIPTAFTDWVSWAFVIPLGLLGLTLGMIELLCAQMISSIYREIGNLPRYRINSSHWPIVLIAIAVVIVKEVMPVQCDALRRLRAFGNDTSTFYQTIIGSFFMPTISPGIHKDRLDGP